MSTTIRVFLILLYVPVGFNPIESNQHSVYY